jgi:maltose-binding protein MalE
MKKVVVALIAIISLSAVQVSAQSKQKSKKAPQSKSRDEDGIDGRMKGPNGEVVYIGEKGGRYYKNASGNKVYVPLGGKGLKSRTGKTVTKIQVK